MGRETSAAGAFFLWEGIMEEKDKAAREACEILNEACEKLDDKFNQGGEKERPKLDVDWIGETFCRLNMVGQALNFLNDVAETEIPTTNPHAFGDMVTPLARHTLDDFRSAISSLENLFDGIECEFPWKKGQETWRDINPEA